MGLFRRPRNGAENYYPSPSNDVVEKFEQLQRKLKGLEGKPILVVGDEKYVIGDPSSQKESLLTTYEIGILLGPPKIVYEESRVRIPTKKYAITASNRTNGWEVHPGPIDSLYNRFMHYESSNERPSLEVYTDREVPVFFAALGQDQMYIEALQLLGIQK